MVGIRDVHIEKFKAIESAPFAVGRLNVLVGANNSGKSSIIQGLHFGVGLMQTIQLAGGWANTNQISTSINPTQVIYSPSENVNSLAMGGHLREAQEHAIKVTFTLDNGEECSVSVRKGRNRNILVSIENPSAAEPLASLENPFTIFSPGLAGVSKTESYVSDGVLLRTIARGDANLVLRNLLLRLWESGHDSWDAFINDIQTIFPEVDFFVSFDFATDEFIDVVVTKDERQIPLELVGTGVLQAAQILSYIHHFSPSLVVLDEPDSHLHPNNQRLLCSLLRDVAEERDTQIILTTHSRHVVDSLGVSTNFLWVRNGTVNHASEDDEIGILMDIGALDIKEQATNPNVRAVVLTEDEVTRPLATILESSGFDMERTVVLPYYGVTSLKNLRPLIGVIGRANPNASIVVHQDRDYLTDDMVERWKVDVRAQGADPFVTRHRDVESHFIDPVLLGEGNRQDPAIFEEIIDEAIRENEEVFIREYVNGVIDRERKQGNVRGINYGQVAVEARQQVEENPARFAYGKSLLKMLRLKFRDRTGGNLQMFSRNEDLASDDLRLVARRVFGSERD